MMHTRYEAALEGFNRIDAASFAPDKTDRDDQSLGFRCDSAKATNSAKTELPHGLFHKVPTTGPEAMVVLFHIHVAFGLTEKPALKS